MTRGAVVWMTGLVASGKSTLGRRLCARIRELGRAVALLDGDEVREALVPKPAHSARARDAFYATLARLAGLLAAQGLCVVVAATANRRGYRDAARALAPRFVEVHVATPREECERRDGKGLYARARRGEIVGLPGVDAPYEAPILPEVVATGGEDGAALDTIVGLLAD
jgi:adenylylsulfate kinase